MTLASHAAIALDRMEYDENLTALNRAEFDLAQMVAHHEEWDLLLEKVFQEITTTLHYSHVNLSLVHNNRIKTESVGGPWLTPAEKEQFKSLADHPIAPEATADEDIQSYVVRTQHIVVPRKKPPRHDKRFDPKIHFRFRYDQLVLVYIPMVLGGEVLGTVEAGYPRRYKKHIYERDIQILKGFVDYVSVAIAQRRRELLEKLSHEFNDAIRGVRSNAVFLRAKWKGMDEEKISRKFGDILSDCDVLNLQVRRLEFYLGGAYPQPRLEMTSIGPNVLVKTINQLEPELKRRGFRSADIDLNYDQFADVRALVDHAQLCEVMNNLFSNAIKYADPEEPFRMKILINERHDYCVLKIQDWGIGIKPEYEEKIFADGFRTPEAIAMAHGTGFGLWLSRLMMRHMGGDLRLSHHRKPTEFEIHLLKRAGTRKKQ